MTQPLWKILGWEHEQGVLVTTPDGRLVTADTADRSVTEIHLLDWLAERTTAVHLARSSGQHHVMADRASATFGSSGSTRRAALAATVRQIHDALEVPW